MKTHNSRDLGIIISFAVYTILLTIGCSKDEVTTPDKTKGYKLTEHLIETANPCFVNIMFQVSDMDSKGVVNLVTEDFEVREDDQAVSPTESAMSIKKKDAISYNLKTVLMIDNSTSVGGNIDQIHNAAHALVNNIVSQQEIAIYVFSENAILIQDFTSDVSALTTAINTISLGYATTNLYGSVSTGVSRWDDFYSTSGIEQGFMILITDGSDTQGSSTLSSALNSIGNKKVYTVGLGSEQDQNALEQLGTAGYFSLNDYSELTTKFTIIQDEMSAYANSFYWLYYMSPKRGDKYHSLKLLIKDNSNMGSDSYINGDFNSSGFYSVQQGVVINAGIDSLNINPGDTYSLTATTYLPKNTPDYSWQTSEASVVTVTVSPENNATATINAIGSVGQSASITATDNSNSLSKPIVINILDTPEGQFTDSRDGKAYQTIQIGDQIWMAENLNYEISNGSWIYNNNSFNADTYGRLYDWETASGVCPSGWHLPSDAEWKELEIYLGMSLAETDNSGWRGTTEGGKLKASYGWHNNGNGTNESGFSALPGGGRFYDGTYGSLGEYARFWTDTESGVSDAWSRYLIYNSNEVQRGDNYKMYGRSVRCIMD